MLTYFRHLAKGDLNPEWNKVDDIPKDTFPASGGTAAWNRVMFVFTFCLAGHVIDYQY